MAKGRRGPFMTDISTILAAGINPKTSLPIRYDDPNDKEYLDDNIRKLIRIIDEQEAVNRYVWTGLPSNITSQELERFIYYKGQLVFFYYKDLKQFFFMPYALDGTIDFYGRYNTVKPVPMTSGTTDDDKKRYANQLAVLSMLSLKVHYGVVDEDDLEEEDLYNSGVLLHDYTKQLAQNIIPRQELNDPLITVESEMIPFLRTSLLSGTGVRGIRVSDADQHESVMQANRSIVSSAKKGNLYLPIIGNMDMQDLANKGSTKTEEYLIAMQSIDNFRMGTHGIENGGLFEKKAHVLDSEMEVNNSSVSSQLQDGLSIRQNFCNIVNSIWGLGMWCEPSENVTQMDMDGDGVAYDRNDEEDTNQLGGQNDSNV